MPNSPDLFFAGGECLTKHGVWVRRTSLPEDIAETFTRTGTEGVSQAPDGKFTTCDANIPRAAYPVVGASHVPALLTERAATNVCLQTEDFTATWTNATGITVTANDAVAPDGATTADELDESDAANLDQMFQNVTVADDSTSWCFSVFIKKTTGAVTFYPAIQLGLTGGTGIVVQVVIDTTNGTIANGTTAPDASGIEDYSTDWWRVWLAQANNGTGNVTAQPLIAPAWNTTGSGSEEVAAVGAIHAWGTQLENTSRPTSYIPVGTSPISETRNIESFSAPFPFKPQAMTAYWKGVWRAADQATSGEFPRLFSVGAIGNEFAVYHSPTGARLRVFHDPQTAGVTGDITTGALAVGDLVEVVAWLNADGSVQGSASINSGAATSDSASSADALGTAWGAETIYLGTTSAAGTGALPVAHLLALKLTRGIKTLAEMRAMT